MRKDFETHLLKYLSHSEIEKLKNVENDDSYIALLIDEEKVDVNEFYSNYPFLEKHPFVNNAFIVKKDEYPFGKSLDFELGNFYILEPCSLMVNHILKVNENDVVLDCCAAPGGKTIHASFNMKNNGLIIANELNYQRSLILSSNVEKYGRKNIVVTNNDILEFPSMYEGVFTKIILDAPCSGSGMFRKEEKMEDDWSLEKVKSLSLLQKEIILKAYSLLKEGGELLYSTCSFSYEEDEEVILHLLNNTDAELINIEDSPLFYRSSLNKTIHLFPYLFKGEGHFLAHIKKPLNGDNNYLKIRKNLITNEIVNNINGYVFKNNETINLLSSNYEVSKLKIIRNGLILGQMDKKLGFIPSHSYSRVYSTLKDSISLSKEETISYINGNPINKNISEKGYKVLSYKNSPFSLTKISNNILKNHYPKGLRKQIKY